MPDRPHLYSLDELNARLQPRLRELAARLFPRFAVHGNQLWFVNPARAKGNLTSASINLVTGVWKDFAAGDDFAGKGGLSLIAAFACGGDFKRAIFWAKDFLGLTDKAPDPAYTQRLADQAREDEAKAKAAADRKRRAALALYLEAKPLDGHDPASEYLASRAIDIAALDCPRALRFHPAVPVYPGQETYAAMLACMSREGLAHGFAAVHRTYLDRVEGRWVKAWGGVRAKQILGAFAGASVRLTPGASGKRLHEARKGEWVQLGEGIENMLTAAAARPELRTIAAGTITNLANVGATFPAAIEGIWLIADNDEKPEARAQFERECERLSERFELQIVRAIGAKDLNAAVMG